MAQPTTEPECVTAFREPNQQLISEHSIFRIVTSNGHLVAAQEAVQDFCHLPT
jgi:hypothetical protein